MDHSRISISKLVKEVLQEIGDLNNIKPFPNLSNNIYNMGNGNKLRIDIFPISLDESDKKRIPRVFDLDEAIFNIGFKVNDVDTQAFKSEPKILFRVLKTVSDRINMYLMNQKKNNVYPLFIIGAQSKTIDFPGVNDPQKLKLYRQIITKNLPPGYRVQNIDNFANGYDVTIFQKIIN